MLEVLFLLYYLFFRTGRGSRILSMLSFLWCIVIFDWDCFADCHRLCCWIVCFDFCCGFVDQVWVGWMVLVIFCWLLIFCFVFRFILTKRERLLPRKLVWCCRRSHLRRVLWCQRLWVLFGIDCVSVTRLLALEDVCVYAICSEWCRLWREWVWLERGSWRAWEGTGAWKIWQEGLSAGWVGWLPQPNSRRDIWPHRSFWLFSRLIWYFGFGRPSSFWSCLRSKYHLICIEHRLVECKHRWGSKRCRQVCPRYIPKVLRISRTRRSRWKREGEWLQWLQK